MYKELVKRLREESEIERWLQPHSANETPKLLDDAADAIEKLVKIWNSLLSKYEEEAEAVIREYSWNIDENIDELRKEIEDYKAQINSVVEPMEKEHTDV